MVGLLGAFSAGCSSSEADLRQTCETRQSWSAASSGKCAECKSAAVLPKCDCEAFEGFGAACASEAEARSAESSCTASIDQCVKACGDACGCEEACYDNASDCKAATAERDACVNDVCAPYCDPEPA